jgi:hypothetical protein
MEALPICTRIISIVPTRNLFNTHIVTGREEDEGSNNHIFLGRSLVGHSTNNGQHVYPKCLEEVADHQAVSTAGCG